MAAVQVTHAQINNSENNTETAEKRPTKSQEIRGTHQGIICSICPSPTESASTCLIAQQSPKIAATLHMGQPLTGVVWSPAIEDLMYKHTAHTQRYVHVCACRYLYLCVSVCVCVCVCVRAACGWVHTQVCANILTYIYIYICVCVIVFFIPIHCCHMCERRGRKREKDTEIKNKTGDDGGIKRERVLEKEKKGQERS